MALEGYIITDNGRIVLVSGYYKVDGKVVKPPVDIDEKWCHMGMEQADAKQLMGNTHFSVPYKDNPKRNRLGSRRLGGSWESCKVQAANQGDNATLLRLAEHKLNQVMIALRDQPFHWFSPSHWRWVQVLNNGGSGAGTQSASWLSERPRRHSMTSWQAPRTPGSSLPIQRGVLEILCQSFNLYKRGLHNDKEVRF
jgi:hypothetical protein